MATEWVYWLHAITIDKPLGDAVGCAINPDTGSTEEFITPLRPISSDDTLPSAWFTGAPLKQSGHDIVAEFAAGGYPALFTGAGFTHAQIDLARASITLEYGPRSEVEGHGLAFIAAQGYEIIPDA
jgi:hypothetical protein